MVSTPEVPKVEEPKIPIKPQDAAEDRRRRSAKPKGQNSLISAGRLSTKATTVKSSLLGGS